MDRIDCNLRSFVRYGSHSSIWWRLNVRFQASYDVPSKVGSMSTFLLCPQDGVPARKRGLCIIAYPTLLLAAYFFLHCTYSRQWKYHGLILLWLVHQNGELLSEHLKRLTRPNEKSESKVSFRVFRFVCRLGTHFSIPAILMWNMGEKIWYTHVQDESCSSQATIRSLEPFSCFARIMDIRVMLYSYGIFLPLTLTYRLEAVS